ncbi:MAG: ATP-binding protein [Eubacteriales bacterium]|nr:ATP-binding protein [Eubacteriales bacterium]
MKVITEDIIRAELRATKPDVYYIPEGKLLSPAAREYLNQMQVAIDFERNRAANERKAAREKAMEERKPNQSSGPRSGVSGDSEPAVFKPKYVDYETGAGYMEKPEFMTQLFGNKLVDKNNPRIKYRGKLDRLQAEVVNAQCVIDQNSKSELLVKDLDDILDCLRKLMVAEILEQDYTKETIIGLNHAELREHSHNPMKYYKIKQMTLPDHSMGIEYAQLNLIRASIREAELAAVDAFQEGRKVTRVDIIEELNRLSSALHIMMCKYLAGDYKTGPKQY